MKDDTKAGLAVGAILLWMLLALAMNVGIIWIVLHFVFKYW